MSEFYSKIEKIMFLDIDDLFDDRENIRKEYNKLDYETKVIYKWYFYYQLCLLKNPLKSTMWDYLNNFNVETKLIEEYMIFCNKRRKIDYNQN